MNQSIKTVFNNLFMHMIFILLFSIFTLLILLDMNMSQKKTDNLVQFKSDILHLSKLQSDNDQIAQIQFSHDNTQLINIINKLHNLQKYNYTNKLFLSNNNIYTNNLQYLEELTDKFNHNVNRFLFDELVDSQEIIIKETLKTLYHKIDKHIDTLLVNELLNHQTKLPGFSIILVFLFALILIYTIMYKNLLNKIYKDLFLLSQATVKTKQNLFFQETKAIFLQTKTKNTHPISESSMIDEDTGIYNYQGLIYTYKHKSTNETLPSSVTVFEIDNFPSLKAQYHEEFIQNILKKIAYTLSLYQHANDIIARTAKNQFTVISVRSTKKDLLNEMMKIQQNIHDLKFPIKDQQSIKLTISGGFSIKTNSIQFEDAMKNSKTALELAQKHGGAKIYQERDVKMAQSV